MSVFDAAFSYLIENEGGFSDDPQDSGHATMYGITYMEAQRHGYDVRKLTLEQAKQLYLKDYWRFDSLTVPAVAAKIFDMAVNVGVQRAVILVQRAMGLPADGIFGPATAAKINATDPGHVLEKISMAASDYYVDIVIRKPSQLVFLKGWLRRAVRRPSF